MTKHDHGLKEKVEGAIDKVKGEVKEVVGKVTDNKKLQAEGKWDKVKGTAKDTVGNVKEKVHEYKEHKKKIKEPIGSFYFPSFSLARINLLPYSLISHLQAFLHLQLLDCMQMVQLI